MRVLFVVHGRFAGGVETLAVALARRLPRFGIDVGVAFLLDTPRTQSELTALGVPWWNAGLSRDQLARARGGTAPDVERVDSVIAGFRPDLLYACTDLPIASALRLARVRWPEVVRVAGAVGRMSTHLSATQEELTSADAVISVARHLGATLMADFGVDPSRIATIHSGVDIPRTAADPGVEPPVAVCVANFLPIKGHRLLMASLAATRSPVTVRLRGEGPRLASIAQLAESLPAHVRIEFVPALADLQAELARAQFAIQPSMSEGLPNAVLEEMSTGLPVVATDIAGHAELIEHGRTGLLAPRNPVDLAMMIDSIGQRPDLRRALGAAARESMRAFSWERCAEEYARTFWAALASRRVG